MSTALIAHEAHLGLLFDAGLLCEVCQEVVWTQRARWCDALICGDCAQGEPEPEEEAPETVFPLIVKVLQVCGLYQGRVVLPSGAYLYTPAHYRRYADALHAACALV